MRTIDADAMKADVKSLDAESNNSTYKSAMVDMLRFFIKFIDNQPTIEVEPVRYGRWINNTFCSECKRFPVDVSVSISNQELTKYFSRCPHCGARMIKCSERNEHN